MLRFTIQTSGLYRDKLLFQRMTQVPTNRLCFILVWKQMTVWTSRIHNFHPTFFPMTAYDALRHSPDKGDSPLYHWNVLHHVRLAEMGNILHHMV